MDSRGDHREIALGERGMVGGSSALAVEELATTGIDAEPERSADHSSGIC
jgi:hypothetical protein